MPAIQSSSQSSLDSPSYDPVNHLNSIFCHASTLKSVSAVRSSIVAHQSDLDQSISNLVQQQRSHDASSIERIQAAKAQLPELFSQIDSVRSRAANTESTITDMTSDIKRLDATKRNLTLSMTALKRLQMLTTAYEQLRSLARTRQYRDCAQLLQAVVQLVAQFRSYRAIDQIAALHKSIIALQADLLEQVCNDFENAFATTHIPLPKPMLSEACAVMDALGDQARQRLIAWYCNTQLREYRQIFRGSDEAGSLDNIARRYSWFNRMIKSYDQEHASIFPPHWRVGEMLANAFCEGTRDDFKAVLQKSVRRTDGQPLDVNLLLSCLQETLNFEHSIEKRFIGESRSSVDTMASRDDRSHAMGQIISEAFEPYMTLWVESQDKQLAKLIPLYRQQPLRNAEDDFSPQAVMPSSTELFHFYRLALAQCAKLSTGSRLLELAKTFAKYLDEYGQKVLSYSLTERSGTTGPSLEDTIVILNTADYCYITSTQLDEKIRSRIDEDLRGQVDLQSQADAFIGIASSAIRTLVKRVESNLDLVWREMKNFPWAKIQSVVDHSSFVTEMVRIIQTDASNILKFLHKPQYTRAFCDNLVDSIALAYCSNVFQCKPISEVASEQMLLDSYTIKKSLMEVPTLGAEAGAQPSAAFAKRAAASTAKIDSLLKTLQVRPSPPEALVQAYLIHIADRSENNFRKILELKGIRKAEQVSLVDLFNAFCQSPANLNLPQSVAWLAGLQFSATMGPPAVGGAMASAVKEGVAGGARFDAATLGSAIMNAAREGVDRLGTPGMGGESSGGSPGPGSEGVRAANINENLKNFGKFFSREGGFGRFGRGGSGDATPRPG